MPNTIVLNELIYVNILWKQKTIKVADISMFKIIGSYHLFHLKHTLQQNSNHISFASFVPMSLGTVPGTLYMLDKDMLH